jgi:hypothetical protein
MGLWHFEFSVLEKSSENTPMKLIFSRWHFAVVVGLILIWLAAGFTNFQSAGQPDPAKIWAVRLGVAYGLGWTTVFLRRLHRAMGANRLF